ncbi:hypothetical protein [Caenibius sp. WL]|uniref:hypothetical protein n=1 Tax=Caenibius sp. WL TaxID=2872646 RepID=UPI001C995533|nr:hypothetical protein [Caenibius sp. WL]QZP07793.1 hypothetical protein K5X80_14240 [Caenibius sp. WL]QZP09974.1 hypothetical protein K5X80_16965 [Caenibius sp. WL]
MSSHCIEKPHEHERIMTEASEAFATRIALARSGVALKPKNDLIWRIPFQGRPWPVGSDKWRRGEAVRKAFEQREALVETLRVSRDPCPRCNTRKDIGCKHFPLEVQV